MPYLNFSTEDFDMLPKFSKFVTHVLSCHNNELEVSSVNLSFRGKVTQVCVKRILKYALSHNVQHLTITCLSPYDEVEFPDYLFRSRSLKHLTITGYKCKISIMSTSSWELPSLSTLYFKDITFYGEITDKRIGVFSKCSNLKNLTINNCRMSSLSKVDICHPSLSNLTLEHGRYHSEHVNVVAPQLKNLTIINWSRVHVRSANKLVSLVFEGYHCLKLSPKSLPSLEKVDLCIYTDISDKEHAHKIVDLLQQLCCAKFVTLNLEILQLLSSFKEVISHQPSPFANLKCLKVYPHGLHLPKVQETMPAEVGNYLLESSPGAIFTMVSYEEMRALKNATSAQNFIAELQALLEQENRETNRARTDRCKVDKGLDHSGSMTQINICWKDMSVQIEQEKKKTGHIISKLDRIEGLLKKLPASKRDKIQPCFSSLCSEAHNVVNKIMHCMMTKFKEKQSKLSVCFDELANPPQPST